MKPTGVSLSQTFQPSIRSLTVIRRRKAVSRVPSATFTGRQARLPSCCGRTENPLPWIRSIGSSTSMRNTANDWCSAAKGSSGGSTGICAGICGRRSDFDERVHGTPGSAATRRFGTTWGGGGSAVIKNVISSAQNTVEIAALIESRQIAITAGGWMPTGFLRRSWREGGRSGVALSETSSGRLGLRALAQGSFSKADRANLAGADLTLLFDCMEAHF